MPAAGYPSARADEASPNAWLIFISLGFCGLSQKKLVKAVVTVGCIIAESQACSFCTLKFPARVGHAARLLIIEIVIVVIPENVRDVPGLNSLYD